MDITTTELFDSLLEVNVDGECYDLHNDFLLGQVEIDPKSFIISLRSRDQSVIIRIEFKDVSILECRVRFEEGILDNFHRARVLDGGLLYDEVEGRKCFVLEFVDGGFLQILSHTAELTVIKGQCV